MRMQWSHIFVSTLELNNVRIEGSGTEAMVFVHGFGCDQTMWKFVEPEFRRDFLTVRYDLTGCGKSDISRYDFAAYATLQGHVDDLLRILAELSLTPVTLVGHSVSAITGLLASIQAPGRFHRQIMVAPSPCCINDGDYIGGFERSEIESLLDTLDLNYLGWANSMAPAIMGNQDRPELAEDLRKAFCRTDPKIASHFAGVTFYGDHRKNLPQSSVPALILQCSEDLIAPLSVGNYIHQHLPQSKLVVMDATGHCPQLSAPEELIACMRTYIKQS